MPDESNTEPSPAPPGVIRSAEADAEGYRQDIWIGAEHHLLADEPASFGGTGLGPSPYQLLAAGLAACTSMTIRMYARRKGWPLAHVAVDVSHDKIHARDCEDCPEAPVKADIFHRAIRLDGPLDSAQRDRLMEIADRCPVHQTLEGTIRIRTRLADA